MLRAYDFENARNPYYQTVNYGDAQTNSRVGQRGVLPVSSEPDCEFNPVVADALAGVRASAALGVHVGGGEILIVAGLIALVQAFVRSNVEGFGTPAPAAAPERLVVSGAYHYVRNPCT